MLMRTQLSMASKSYWDEVFRKIARADGNTDGKTPSIDIKALKKELRKRDYLEVTNGG
jgi:hypothetical protein